MMDIALASGAALAVGLSYLYGKSSVSTDGCNGHHWGEKQFPDDDGVSSTKRHKAGLKSEIVNHPENHYTAEVFGGRVILYGKAIQRCRDCGELKVESTQIGSMSPTKFE